MKENEMAQQIRMTPSQLIGRAGEYTVEAGKVQETIDKMDRLLKNLESEWEGAAAQSYAAKFSELRPGFVKAKDLIDEIAAALTKTAQIVEETDANIAKQLRS
jgi:WXG100 family type VII secretion target